MTTKNVKISKSVTETAEIAKIFLDNILKNKSMKSGATVVGLSGDLGAGKTAFTQSVAKHLGIKDKVNSPTFVIMKKYPIKSQKHKFLFHLDAYRLKNEKELLHLGWDEIVSNKEHLVFIEWPENVAKVMPKHAHQINISANEQGKRKFKLK